MTRAHSLDYAPQYAAAREVIAGWLADGSLKRKFHIVEGLENAPKALPMLFNGGNTGKLCVLSHLGVFLYSYVSDAFSRVIHVSGPSAKL